MPKVFRAVCDVVVRTSVSGWGGNSGNRFKIRLNLLESDVSREKVILIPLVAVVVTDFSDIVNPFGTFKAKHRHLKWQFIQGLAIIVI